MRNCCIYDEEEHKIIAFYEGEIDKKQIIRTLGKTLPGFMIPIVFVQLDVSRLRKMERLTGSS